MTPEAMPAVPSVHVAHVLVPLDGSELALQAMPTARALADRFGAELHAITVAGNAKEAERARQLAAAVLDVPVSDDRVVVVEGGDAAETIAQRAESLGRCVVCLGTRGRGRLRGALIGSVARSVLQRSKEPIVALGPMADNPGWSPRPRSWPEPLTVPRIVACVDGSATSEQVLPIAAGWARALDMSLTILTVVDDDGVPVVSPRAERRYGDHPDATTYVQDLVQTWRATTAGDDAPTEVDGVVLRDPIGPADGIRLHLDQRPASLVALTTQARTGIRRVLLGATAASIVHASVAPCLVAPVEQAGETS